jgi:hypothetical protein
MICFTVPDASTASTIVPCRCNELGGIASTTAS